MGRVFPSGTLQVQRVLDFSQLREPKITQRLHELMLVARDPEQHVRFTVLLDVSDPK